MSKLTQKNTFGSEMEMTCYRNSRDIDVYFPEYDWTAEHVNYKHFRNGQIRCPYEPRVCGIGYIGEGDYKPTENNKKTDAYSTWSRMIVRCYDHKYHEKYPTYKDCIVSEEWHNFQNFAEWYENNFYQVEEEKMHLDKDILSKCNKVYSSDTCIFVPASINTLFVKKNINRGNLPIGVSYHKRNKKYCARCSINSKNSVLGYYNTPEEAFQTYKEAKELEIQRIADKYVNLIPEVLYDAMYSYEVDLND